ncbi:MAG: AIR synthase related protein, partial [Actinomycetota bacterium]|nr:AIR synthase related protein [Actinomycetota bacterium]
MTDPSVPAAPGTLAAVGEFAVVGAVRAVCGDPPDAVVGPGDDAAVVAIPVGQDPPRVPTGLAAHVVVSTDLLVEHRHFRRDWSSAADVGHKAAAANLSDISAMGGRAAALVVAFGGPGDLEVGWVQELAAGLATEAAAVGAAVVGGDVTAADAVTVAVTALGWCESGAPVRRSGARPGDLVAVCGRLGWAAAGLSVLGRG